MLNLDSCSVRAKRAGDLTGPNPTHRGKRGTKYHVAVTGDGIPVACPATAANVNDTLVFERLFLAAFAVMARIGTVFADKGYDAEPHRDLRRICTDPARAPLQIVAWFVQRWQVEVTSREVRGHLGVETQRQWSDLAIARTTPCLLGLFSLVVLLAARLSPQARSVVATAAWYRKKHPTFSDTLAAVRREVWREQGFLTSRKASETTKSNPSCTKASLMRSAAAHELSQMAKAKLSARTAHGLASTQR